MKLHWKTGEKPTGRYRSFFRRPWPAAYLDGQWGTIAFYIGCEDEYVPAKAKAGQHSELTIHVADYQSVKSGFTWRRLKARATTLADAKRIAQEFADANPNFFMRTT